MKDKIYNTFRALRHRNYILFFIGQCISLIGTWIQQIAISWLVYRLTNSALLMGTVMFCSSIPSLVLAPFAGVFVDRVNKHKYLIIVQVLFMLQALILGVLTITGVIKVWHIIAIGTFLGIITTFDMPLRQSFVVQLVDDISDLGNAISLNSTMFNLARMIGPALGGILIAAFGEGTCFLINALSYIAVILALFAMKINYKSKHVKTDENILRELKEGFIYAFKVSPIRNALLGLAVASFIGMGYQVLMPIFAEQVLKGNAQTLGFLMSISGIGALIGALKLASRVSTAGLERVMFIATLLFGLALIGLSHTSHLMLASLLLFVTGYGMVTIMASSNTIIQDNVEEAKRGRVMSLYTMAFIGTAPLGSLLEGAIANKIGVPYTFFISGIIILASALVINLLSRKE